MNILPSKLAQAILELRGKPLNLTDYKPFELVYDMAPHTLTACCGRQIGKSVSLGAGIISNSILRPHFATLFISPLSQQTSRFSSQYLAPFMNSRIVSDHFVDSTDKKNVFLRTFNNGSSVTLGYADTEQAADRIRGVSADSMFFDEIQDASAEAIPILEETLSASDFGFRRFTGTAKGEANTLTKLFRASNMMEWVTKCDACGKYTIPNEYEVCMKVVMGNPLGPACVHCNALLDMKKGYWVAGRPHEKKHIGVHIPQFCIPARTKITATGNKWEDLVEKSKRYDYVKVCNEVFGLPVGAGGRPLSERNVKACCNPSRPKFDTEFPVDDRHIVMTVMGVDWSVTGSTHSHTVLTVLGYDSLGKCYILYSEKLDGMELMDQVLYTMQVFHQFQCTHLAADRGCGAFQGRLLKDGLGNDKVSMINYVAAQAALRYEQKYDYFPADKTSGIDRMVSKIKLGSSKIESPSWDIMEFFWSDCLHVYEEETNSGRRIYKRDDDAPDDFLHSIVFANLAWMIVNNQYSTHDREVLPSSELRMEDILNHWGVLK